MSTVFPDSHKDLLQAPFASLTTIGSDGFPQATIIWFLHDEGKLKLSLNQTRLKARNLMKRPRVSLMILDLENPMRYLDVRANVSWKSDAGYEFASQLAAKYGDVDISAHDDDPADRLVVTLEPVNVYAVTI